MIVSVEASGFFRWWDFSMFASAGLLAFALVAALGMPAIGLLKRLSFKQSAYEDAPKTHAVKTGTPTMGGLLFALALAVFAILAALVLDRPRAYEIFELASLGIACAAIGFADDYSGIVRGKNRGLGGRQKFGLTAVVGILFLLGLGLTPGQVATDVIAIGSFHIGVPAWVWYALSLIAIVSTTHSVNLTDGLDGLAAGTVIAPLVLLAYIAAHDFATWSVGAIDLVTVGAAFGFLVYNKHPAKVFMGDTGSLLLGGILAGSAIMLDQQLLLPLIGAVFAAEALSVIIQVAYFKRTGKRIFLMSPLHHHFEVAGWPETKVTARFRLASVVVSLLGFVTTLAPSAAS